MTGTTEYIEVNGIKLYVRIEGSGPDILLIHGFPDDGHVWRNQVPALVEAGFRVIVPDTRGTGDSELLPNKKDYHIDYLVGDMIALLDHLGLDKVKLVAHDWGAAISWNLVFRHPERFERYVAISVGHLQAYGESGLRQKLKAYYILFFQIPWLSDMLLKLGDWWLFNAVTGKHPEFLEWKKRLSRPGRFKAALDYYRANLKMMIPGKWPRVSVPVMGIWSEYDIALEEEQMMNTANFVDAPFEYHRVDGASHWPQIDKPEEINRLLIDYLKKDLAG